MWTELKALLKDHPAKVMVREGEPLRETAEKLKVLGLSSVVFDPCGNTVNVKKATYTNDIGDSQLAVVWTDPHFDPTKEPGYVSKR